MTDQARILLVEDDDAIATVIGVAMRAEAISVDRVATLAQRNERVSNQCYDAIVTDVVLPDGNGLDGLPTLMPSLPPVVVLSAQNTLDTALRASQQGAFDYLPKPFDLDELVAVVRAAIVRGRPDAASPLRQAERGDEPELVGPPIIGRAPSMQQVYRTLARVAPTDLTVLILGESGTGKELVAAAIHQNSHRSDKKFVAVNMAAIPRELIESELFGHEKGAFTGASARSSGRFEQAEGGTLFLDEIGDMPFEAQTRLLRVLQSGDYSPVGSARTMRANVRIVAATNQNLAALVQDGRFRDDLYYRLNVIPIALPPLRERRSDIPTLAAHFLGEAKALGLEEKQLSAAAAQKLATQDWPGNVRELSNVMQRLALLTPARMIDVDDITRVALPSTSESMGGRETAVGTTNDLESAVLAWLETSIAKQAWNDGDLHQRLTEAVEKPLFDAVLAATAGNQIKAAAILGINRNTLRIKRNR